MYRRYNACIDVQSILRTFFLFFSFLAKKIPKRQLDIRDESFFHVLDAATANRQEH